MPRSLSTFVNAAAVAFGVLVAGRAGAQSCCAGASAVTPGRLGLHETFLIGLQLRGATVFGSWDKAGRYAAAEPGAHEHDFEQDLFASVRFLRRGQIALLVPLVETMRLVPRAPSSELGGGFGDANVSLRYDAIEARQFRYAPGVAVLAGATLPTGVAPEAAEKPLATDATGIGAVQLHAAVALEKGFGPVLVSLTGLVAKRLPRSVGDVRETLGTQWTVLASCALSLPKDAAVALSGSYSAAGNTVDDGVDQPDTGRRLAQIALSGVLPLSDRVRLQASAFANPPAPQAGQNQLASAGATLASLFTWL